MRSGDTVAVQPAFHLVVNDTEAAVAGALSGLGLVRVFLLPGERPRPLRGAGPGPERVRAPPIPVRIVYSAREPLPRKIRVFVDFARMRLEDLLEPAVERLPHTPS